MLTTDTTSIPGERLPSASSSNATSVNATTNLLPYSVAISWGSIFAGMVIAVVIQLLLGLVGTGIGLSTLDPMRYSSPDASSLGLGAGIW